MAVRVVTRTSRAPGGSKSGLGALVPVLLFADAVSIYLFWDWVRDSGRGGFESFAITILYLILAGFAGIWAMKIGGGLSLRGAMLAAQRAESPDTSLLNALLALIGGVLIAFPGLASDAIGILLLLPVTRALPRALLRRAIVKRRPQPATPLEVEDYRVE